MKRFIFLAKLGIVESNDADGNYQIQRIDFPESFAADAELNFIPPLLKSDEEAQRVFQSLTNIPEKDTMTKNQKAVAQLESCNIDAREENGTVYVYFEDTGLEISEFEINFRAGFYDEQQANDDE